MLKPRKVQAHVIQARELITKAETATQAAPAGAGEWIAPSVELRGLKAMVTHSAILPQCIRAYRNNIAGFGLGIRYKEDYPEETEAMKAEYDRAKEVLSLLNMDMDIKELFEDIVEAREIYGIAYAEVLRNMVGEVVGLECIRDTPSVEKTVPLEPFVEAVYEAGGQTIRRLRKFMKYRQQVGGQTVYFKEIGDPRVMDRRSGEYLAAGEALDPADEANEILEFAIGTAPYGEVRWIGQTLGVDGSRKAETLNNRYFEEGRHTPLLIMIKGGTLTEESFEKLRQYMDGIRGEAGQHAFMILETEATGNRTDFADEKPPEIEVKDLGAILQKDELFQDYLDNNRRKIQSAFLLPDVYIGYTTDFNRATAQTAQEVTEKQVFQPERRSLAWAVNNKLLSSYGFRYVEAYFKAPEITNPDDIMKILSVTERAGGLTPNKAKEITYGLFGEVSENYEGGWGDVPLARSGKA